MSLMVITCGDCGTIFRLDRALLKDSNVARIRCRKCGGAIVVRLHEESPVPPPPVPAAKEVLPKEDSASAPRTRQEEISLPPAFEADISGVVTPESLPPPPDEKAVPLDNVRIEPENEIPWPAEDAGPDRIPPPPEEYIAGENPPEETAATEPERKAPSRRAPSMLAVLVISVLWILLLAGGVLYFGTTKSGQEMLGTLFEGSGLSRTGSAPESPVYDIRDVKWYVDKSSAGGSLFVIKGAVANVGRVPSEGIRIQATLLGKDNGALAEKAAFAGNLLDEGAMRRMERAEMERVRTSWSGR